MPRQSAAVYRRRRLVLLIAVILVLAVIGAGTWVLIAKPWQSSGADAVPQAPSAQTPSPDADASANATASPSPDASDGATDAPATPAIVACTAKDIEVAAVTDADTYDSAALPKLSISLTNHGASDCTIDVGSATQVFTVMSGADVWWRSTDCQEDPSSMIATLPAGATVVSKDPVVWDRTRSAVETCADVNRPRAPGGGASYHVSVSIGGFAGLATTQILLY